MGGSVQSMPSPLWGAVSKIELHGPGGPKLMVIGGGGGKRNYINPSPKAVP